MARGCGRKVQCWPGDCEGTPIGSDCDREGGAEEWGRKEMDREEGGGEGG